MTFYRKMAVLAIATLIPAIALAEPLEEKRWHEDQQKSLTKAIEDMNKACGAKIATTIDWTTFKFDDWHKHQVGMMCLNPVRAIQNLCGEADAKPEIVKVIKSVTCKGAAAAGVELNGGALEFKVTTQKTPTQDQVKSYLMKKI
jgi:hypothetical protein